MAMEAHHLLNHVGEGRMLAASSARAGWKDGAGAFSDVLPVGTDAAAAGRQSQLQLQLQGYQRQQSSCVGLAAAPTSGPMMTMGRYGQVYASESGDAQLEVVASRKRKRAAEQAQLLGLHAAHLQQQLVDADRLVLQHTANMLAELREQRRRHARQVLAAAARRLRTKDEEMERIGRLNGALEERVRSLSVEARAWRDLARSNEAAVNALRGDLKLALDAAQARRVVAAAADDAASCCGGNENDHDGTGEGEGGEEEVGTTRRGGSWTRRCAACGEGAAEVLLLPCRHLSACATCAGAATACPECGCAKNGTVRVNFS